MREAEDTTTTITGVTKRRRASAKTSRAGGIGGNVINLPARLSGADAIVAEVTARSERQKELIREQMRELGAVLDAQHRARANELLPLALQIDRPTLDNFVEIGRRMLAGRTRA